MAITFWKNKNVFVTGSTGLLGSFLVEELIGQGGNVTCLLRDWVPSSKLIAQGMMDHINVVHGELEDLPVLVRTLNEYEIDSVFHLGAQTIVGTASRSALSTFESNIKGTWNLLEACKVCSRLIQRIVVASSDKAYGEHESLPYTEEMPLLGRYPYDVSKSCADLISLSYYHTYGLPIAVTRCGNLFGPGDLNFNRLVPGTIKSAILNERPIIRSDGKLIRDYFFVRDAAKAYLLLAERLSNESLQGQAFNFGAEKPMPVLDMVKFILERMGKKDLDPIIMNEATNEINRQYLDCSKARDVLGWKPQYSMSCAMDETIEWYDKLLRV
jgi:CDP-glucose 4,6-dehydratase